MPYKHIEGVKVKARFFKESGRLYRDRLEITLKDAPASGKTACVIMMNPSYASEEIADKSVQFMEKNVFLRGLSEFKDVRKLLVVNQFAFIQTHQFKGLPHEIGSSNNASIKAAFKKSEIIIIAWGKGNPFKERQEFVFGLLRKMKNKNLFITQSHPSRGRYDGFIKPLTLL